MANKCLISIIVWKEQARTIEKILNIRNRGDKADINTKVFFENRCVEGRAKVLITLEI